MELIILSEHTEKEIPKDYYSFLLEEENYEKKFKNKTEYFCFKTQKKTDENGIIKPTISSHYYVGVDWLIQNKVALIVEPKINTALFEKYNNTLEREDGEEGEFANQNEADNISDDNLKEMDYLRMLLDIMSHPVSAQHVSEIIDINWEAPRIAIRQKKDFLTPFLVIQFLQILRTIVRKGLKKSYYKVEENLQNQVKGKILVGRHIKTNVFKNRFTNVLCEYQEFGINNLENKFLKKVYQFCTSYVDNNSAIFKENAAKIKDIINYCRPAFEKIDELKRSAHEIVVPKNPFFNEYKEAIKIGKYIRKQFSYNISKTTETIHETPSFWIDMPILFELYVYTKLLGENPQIAHKIHYQFGTHGNHLDFLISDENHKMIIDTKYKLAYLKGKVHQDIRQVSGYARLRKVRESLGILENSDEIINCIIIYPTLDGEKTEYNLDKFILTPIKAYHKVYKYGVNIPVI